jgi:hypothetical protein
LFPRYLSVGICCLEVIPIQLDKDMLQTSGQSEVVADFSAKAAALVHLELTCHFPHIPMRYQQGNANSRALDPDFFLFIMRVRPVRKLAVPMEASMIVAVSRFVI